VKMSRINNAINFHIGVPELGLVTRNIRFVIVIPINKFCVSIALRLGNDCMGDRCTP
jgi:hypothetical protein